MPIKDWSKYPPNWKTEIRPAIIFRANNCCEKCGIPNYSVGHRDLDGIFHRVCGNTHYDAAGNGELSYTEALKLVRYSNELNDDEYKLIIIVLTIAHLDHDTTNNDYSNLKALCQKCHNRHDIPFRKANRKNKKGLLTLAL
jgi:5-methylcytosine-specific restriction endonuclease McrA